MHFLKILISGHFLAILTYIFVLLLIPKILMERRQSGATFAWLLAIGLIPYIGIPLYFLIGGRHIRRKIALKKHISSQVKSSFSVEDIQLSPVATAVTDVFKALTIFPPIKNMEVKLIDDGITAFSHMMDAIQTAREFIHVEFFLFKNDETGKSILDALRKKAAEGVKVRLLLDSVGTLHMHERMFAEYKKAGGELAFFLPVLPLRRKGSANLRNHRKLLLIDREIAFTGSMNLAYEYLGKTYYRERWKDLLVELKGTNSVFQKIFLDDWAFAAGDTQPTGNFISEESRKQGGSSIIQVVPSGPDQERRALYHGVLAALHHAKKNIIIATPYYVPEESLHEALVMAALRGLSVTLVVPLRSNHPMVRWAGRSYYEDLLSAGVHVYEYLPTMMHIKATVIDEDIGIVGSANMDYRSFNLNFELTVFLYDRSDILTITNIIQNLLINSKQIEGSSFKRRSFVRKFCEDTCRVFSPVL